MLNKFNIFLLLGFFLGGCDEPPSVEVLDKRFGIAIPLSDGKLRFKSTYEVPLQSGQVYMWWIALRTNRSSVAIKETLSLSAEGDWSETDSGTIVSPDKKTGVLKRTVLVGDGVIYGNWSVAKRDPLGPSKMLVEIENSSAVEFDFAFIEPLATATP